MTIDRLGIQFRHKGDDVIWVWPWKRRKFSARFISLGFSGTGEFGDAVYSSLKQLDADWETYFEACRKIEEHEHESF